MSTTALVERAAESQSMVTADQLDLIKRTIAKDATSDELKFYLYDCARQGVHPLDKLVHFTKRQGKYTPITSIDFMRIRAAESGEYAGSDDAIFTLGDERIEAPHTATVTVWRLVQGQRCAFTATARWTEYKPEAGPSGRGDVMWLKMPHTMLAKCAEALALRKGFPRQLAGLYAKEEMDQADKGGYVVEAPVVVPIKAGLTASEPVGNGAMAVTVGPERGDSGIYPIAAADDPNALYVERITKKATKNVNVTKYTLVLSDGREVGTIRDRLAGLAEQCCQDRVAVRVTTTHGKYGEDLLTLERADAPVKLPGEESVF